MNAKRLFIIIMVAGLLVLLMTACSNHQGLPACDYQNGFLGFGHKYVFEGENHPKNTNFVCQGGKFVPAVAAEPNIPDNEPLVDPAPAPMSCNTPSIKAGLTAADVEFGEFLDTNLGKRMTFTSRKVVVPAKAWNDPLTAEELKSVEQTWLFATVCVPEGMSGTIFAGGYEQGINRYENGVLMTLGAGVYEFKIRNGEIVLWYPQQESFSAKDMDRIFEQIRSCNFDIKGKLAFFGTTADLFSQIPQDLVKERNVQIVPSVDPMVK